MPCFPIQNTVIMFLILTRVIAINFESEIKKKNENIGTVQRKNICTTSTSKSKTSHAKQISYTTTTTLFDGYCHWNCWLFSSPWLTSLRNRKSEDRRRDYMNKVIRDVHLSRHALRYKQRKTGLENHEPIKLCNHFTFGQSQRKYTFIIFQFNQTVTDSRL